MKRWSMCLVLALAVGSLAGCSRFEPEQSTVRINKDGSLQAAVVEKLDKDYYSEEELQAEIDEAVAEYNGDSEDTLLLVKKYEVEDDVVNLYIEYASADDYQAFNNVTFYLKDLQGAYDDGYSFPNTFNKVEKGKVTGTAPKSEILSGVNYSVLIYSEEMDVEVPGNILYVSQDVTVTGNRKATTLPAAEELQTEEGGLEVEEGSFVEENGTEETEKETEVQETVFSFIIYE